MPMTPRFRAAPGVTCTQGPLIPLLRPFGAVLRISMEPELEHSAPSGEAHEIRIWASSEVQPEMFVSNPPLVTALLALRVMHLHAPAAHPPKHTRLQLPQWLALVIVSTHSLPHVVFVQAHRNDVQLKLLAQASLHEPQLVLVPSGRSQPGWPSQFAYPVLHTGVLHFRSAPQVLVAF